MFLGLGLTAFFGRSFVSQSIVGFNTVDIPLLSDLPWVGPILFKHDPLTYISFLLVPLVWLLLFRTRIGVILRAVGERDEVVYAYGISPKLVRYLAVAAGGFLAGVGGDAAVSRFHTFLGGGNDERSRYRCSGTRYLRFLAASARDAGGLLIRWRAGASAGFAE